MFFGLFFSFRGSNKLRFSHIGKKTFLGVVI